jgi:hypothetical protein
MRTITTMVLAAALALSNNLAIAQSSLGGVNGAVGGSTVGSSTGSSSIGGVYSPGATSYGSPNIGAGNPGIGDRSDPSIRATPGLDANGPCNGARSTSGNNTPSC